MPSPLNPLTKQSQEELLAGIRATREECHEHYVAMDRALARIEAQCQAGIAICEMLGGRPTKAKAAPVPPVLPPATVKTVTGPAPDSTTAP